VKTKVKNGKASRWRKTDTASARETNSLQYKMRPLSVLYFLLLLKIFFTSQCTSLSSTRFLLEVGRWTSALDQQQVLVGQIELVGAVSVVAAAAAAAVVVEVEIFEVAAQTPAAEVL